MGGELPQRRDCFRFQRFRFCSTERADRRENSAASTRDFFVACTGNALFVFGSAAAGKNQVSVRVDKSGQNHAPTQIQFSCAARFRKARHLVTCSRRDDSAVAHEYGAIAHKTHILHCFAATWDPAAESQEFLAPGDEKGLGHRGTITSESSRLPCERSQSLLDSWRPHAGRRRCPDHW